MDRTAAQEGIVFDFLQTVRSVWAFFVPCGDVPGYRFAFSFRFSAFEDNKVACHMKKVGGSVVGFLGWFVKYERPGLLLRVDDLIFFLTFAALFVGKSEQ